MPKSYQIKQVEINNKGYKVMTTVSTDDPEVAKSLIGSTTASNSTSGKKNTKSSADKKTSKTPKKGVVIDAEFSEVKSKSKATAKKKTVAKPKALPAPAVKKKDSKTKPGAKKETLKAYIYLIKFADGVNRELAIYAPNKAGADKLVKYYLKISGNSLVKYVRTSVAEVHKRYIQKYNVTVDNYYQKQVEALNAAKYKKNSNPSFKPLTKEVKALPVDSKKSISLGRQKMKVELKCLELIKKVPKLKYYGWSNNNHCFQYYGQIYTFKSIPEAIKAFMNYEVWYENGEVKTKKLSGQPMIKPPSKHSATTIKKINSYGKSNRYEFYNKKGERIIIDISKMITDPKDKKSNPNLWVKAGYLKAPIYNYLSVDTSVEDEEGTWGNKYNPTVTGNHKINFKWILDATPQNEKKILNEIYRLANI